MQPAFPITNPNAIYWALHANILLHRAPAPRVVCVDGFNISIQASHWHHCDPMADRAMWSSFELGYPSAEIEGLDHLREDRDTHNTTWSNVPVGAVVKLLESHGGIAAFPNTNQHFNPRNGT